MCIRDRVSAVCSQAFTSELPFKTILQPVDAKLIAIALPIFLPAPVMNAVFPECSMAFPLRYNINLVSYDLLIQSEIRYDSSYSKSKLIFLFEIFKSVLCCLLLKPVRAGKIRNLFVSLIE